MMIDSTLELTATRQCELLGISRSTAYYKPRSVSAEALDLMGQIDVIHTKWPFMGSRAVRENLTTSGSFIGRRHIRTLMRKMGIHAIYVKPRTSITHPEHKVYPYLLRGVPVNRVNQVWAADITYIPMRRGFAYLVAVLDWRSRRVLSWRLSNTLSADSCIAALNEAIAVYGKPDIFNTDQGSQFTSEGFTDVLKENGIQISMDGRRSWIDNVIVERFWKSLKYEEVYLKAYTGMCDARKQIGEYIKFYNGIRTHQSLGGVCPDRFYFEASNHSHAA